MKLSKRTKFLTELRITAKCDWDYIWHVSCPQTKFKRSGKNLTSILAVHAADIEQRLETANL